VASRVRREFAESGRSVPAPLAFRFKAERAVYPMRLTGAGAKNGLEVELVVFGPSGAEVAGLAVRAVAPVEFTEVGELAGRRGETQPRDARKVSHSELKRWAEGTAAATWLRGTLSPAQMQEDVVVNWSEGALPVGLHAMAEGDAWTNALALGGMVCLAGALVGGAGVRFGGRSSWVAACDDADGGSDQGEWGDSIVCAQAGVAGGDVNSVGDGAGDE
jgi:hypothetical protein